jgi:hypothetical protein
MESCFRPLIRITFAETAYDADKFESALNDALGQLDGEVIDIKYSVASAFNGTVAAIELLNPTFPTLETYSAFILYK